MNLVQSGGGRDRRWPRRRQPAKEDFQLFDKGKLQVITKFSMEKSEAVDTPALRTFFAGSSGHNACALLLRPPCRTAMSPIWSTTSI